MISTIFLDESPSTSSVTVKAQGEKSIKVLKKKAIKHLNYSKLLNKNKICKVSKYGGGCCEEKGKKGETEAVKQSTKMLRTKIN